MPEELDAWLRSWQKQKNGKRVEEVHLRQQVLELQEQVNHLRTQLQAYQRAEQQRTIETSCAVKNSFDNSTQRILS